MSTGLTIGSNLQNFTVDSAQVRGYGGVESPHIVVPVSFLLSPGRKSNGSNGASFDLTLIDAELLLTKKLFKASHVIKPIHVFVWETRPYPMELHFPVTRDILYHIEKHREGNLPGSLRLTLQAAYHVETASNTTVTNQPVIRSIDVGWGEDKFTIEQSRWITNVLPQTGYNGPTLVELPPVSYLLPVEYAHALPEVEKARHYFITGDYHKAVSHCRTALDPIHTEFPSKKTYHPETNASSGWKPTLMGHMHSPRRSTTPTTTSAMRHITPAPLFLAVPMRLPY
jgi:hypothetical protein